MNADSSVHVIWFYWRQGLASAPPIVTMCHRSWVDSNPGWDVLFVHAGNEAEYVAMPAWSSRLTPQQYSDVLRLQLLERHGGVWVDATTYCNTPLDDWLAECTPAGFFAFARPTIGQSLDSWFLATREPGHVIVAHTRRFLESYFRTSPQPAIGRAHIVVRKMVYLLLSRSIRTSEWWFSRPVRIGLQLVPYYAIHYAFNRTLRTDAAAAEAWRRTPQLSADGPHVLWQHGLDRSPDPALLRELDAPTTPLYKLSWKSEAANDPRTALGYFVTDRLNQERG